MTAGEFEFACRSVNLIAGHDNLPAESFLAAFGGAIRAPEVGGLAPFRRVQFTPDLLPSDVTGLSVFDPERGGFDFRPGPVFAHILLADEIT